MENNNCKNCGRRLHFEGVEYCSNAHCEFQKNNNIKKTCLSLNCPERKSVCCGAISRSASEPEMMLGVPEFFCSKCGKEFVGGECAAEERIVEKNNPQECDEDCKLPSYAHDVGAKPPLVEEWDYNTKQCIQAMRDRCDWLYNAGANNNGDYLVKTKNFIEETVKMLLEKTVQQERERILEEVEKMRIDMKFTPDEIRAMVPYDKVIKIIKGDEE